MIQIYEHALYLRQIIYKHVKQYKKCIQNFN